MYFLFFHERMFSYFSILYRVDIERIIYEIADFFICSFINNLNPLFPSSILLNSSMFCRQGTHTQRRTTQLFTTILLGTMVQSKNCLWSKGIEKIYIEGWTVDTSKKKPSFCAKWSQWFWRWFHFSGISNPIILSNSVKKVSKFEIKDLFFLLWINWSHLHEKLRNCSWLHSFPELKRWIFHSWVLRI